MIERHVIFDVLSDKTGAFEEFFVREYRPAMSHMPGFVKVELLRHLETPTQYQMLIRFETLEAAAGWRASPEHQALSPRIKELYHSSQLHVYQVIA